jgi:exopolysaccharide biosynthesis polyprenyl glycosylphosphotransferase
VALAAVLGTMTLLSYGYFVQVELFPVRVIVVMACVFCFVLMLVERNILRLVRQALLWRGVGGVRTIVVGDHENTRTIVEALMRDTRFGYRIVGAVTNKKYVRGLEIKNYDNVAAAVGRARAAMMIQTDEADLEGVYDLSVRKHVGYMMVPVHDVMLSKRTSMELVGDLPMLEVKPTTLTGYGRVAKRGFDVVFGVIGLVAAAIPMGVIALIISLSGGDVLYRQKRLTRYGRKAGIYKFRTMRREYHRMSPEEAFVKMGRSELVEEYRRNGDVLLNDPRISRFGRFLRRSSLDELPQLFNVLRGDISLVGPRALVPEELENYPDKDLILSVKSGMTGLAQVSGRREIGFAERRTLDVYYIQNWSIVMDLQILLRTVWYVLRAKGAE